MAQGGPKPYQESFITEINALIAGKKPKRKSVDRRLLAVRDLPFDQALKLMTITSSEGCWLFTGPLYDGYVKNRFNHRNVYTFFKGPIPDGCEVDHKCRVRHCLNPEHLQAVVHRINTALSHLLPTDHMNW